MRGLLVAAVVLATAGCGSESEGNAGKAIPDSGTEASSGGAGGTASGGTAGTSSGGSAGLPGGTGGISGASGAGGNAGAAGYQSDAGVDAEPDAPVDAGPTACSPPSPAGPTSGGVDCTGTCWPSGPPSGYGVGGSQCAKIDQCGGTGLDVGTGFNDWSVILPEDNSFDGGFCPVQCGQQRVFRFNYTLFGGCARFTSSGAHTFSTNANGCGTESACLVTTGVATVYVYGGQNGDAGWVRAETSPASSCPFSCP